MISNERKYRIISNLYQYSRTQMNRLSDIAKLKSVGIQLNNHVSLHFYKSEFVEYFELSEEEYQWIEKSEYIVKEGDYFMLHHERLESSAESLGRLCMEDEQKASVRKYGYITLALLIAAFIIGMCL